MDLNPEKPPRPERPLGVTILAIWFGFTNGLLPIFGAIGLFLRGEGQVSLGTVASLGLAGLIVFAAIGAFRGSDFSRLGLIITLTLQFSITAFDQLLLTVNPALPQDQRLAAYGVALRMGFWALVVSWYFLRSQTIRFYRYTRHSPSS